MRCNHPKLTQIENIEMGGTESPTYQCEKCQELLTVTIDPMEIAVVFGVPKGDPSHCSLDGSPRAPLTGRRFGACTLATCKDRLHDYNAEIQG